MSEWPVMTLGEVCAEGGGFIRTGPFGSQLHQSDYVDDPHGIPVVMPKDMAHGRVDRSTIARIGAETADRLSHHLLAAGDVALSRRGDVGRSAWVGPEDLPVLCGTGSMRVHPGLPHSVEPAYLRYYFRSRLAIDYLEGQAVGATMPNLNADIVKGMPVPVLPLARQRLAADVLAAIDDLIENNRRRVQVLEEMARAIYREWFVHFRYPGHEDVPLVDSPLGPIPEGWDAGTVANLCERIQAGGTPRRSEPTFWSPPEVDWYKTGDLTDSVLVHSSERISERALFASTARSFEPETILMAIYGSPTVGRLGLVEEVSSANQAALGLVADRGRSSTEHLWFVLEGLREHLNQIAQGAAQQNVSKAKVAAAPAVIPPCDVVAAFTQAVAPLWRCSHRLGRQNYALVGLRDLLLPRLVTGQIDVSHLDLDAMAESAPA